MQETKRRERSANFTIAEVRLLSSLTAAYRDSIENKKTDAISNKEKEAAWLKIESMFNAAIVSPQRTAKTLKLKYDGLKKASKKQVNPCQEVVGTDDGMSTDPEMYDPEEKVLAMCTSVYGIDNRIDSDNSIEVATSEAALPKHVQNSSMNETILIKAVQSSSVNETLSQLHLQSPSTTIKCEPIQNHEVEETLSSKIEQDNGLQKVTQNNWEKWKSKLPKTNNLGIIKNIEPNALPKLDKLSAAQLELIQLQIEIAKKDHEFLRIEHELKVEHMNNEERRRQETHDLLIKQIINGNNSPTK